MKVRAAARMKPDWQWVCEATRGGQIVLAEMQLDSGLQRNIFSEADTVDVVALNRRLRRAPAGGPAHDQPLDDRARTEADHQACRDSRGWQVHRRLTRLILQRTM